MAKAYTNRAVYKLRRSFIVFVPERNTKYEKTPKSKAETRRNAPFRGIRVFQHVDDLTQIMWSKEEGDLANRSYNSVRMWAKEVRRSLHMQCSDKNALLEEGVKANIMNHGVDVGTDVTAGRRRATEKLCESEETGKSKAHRVSALSRVDNRCKKMGITGVMPTSMY